MTTIRHIDTDGLPEGYDIADLIESGVTGATLIGWLKARVRPGPPTKPAPKKTPPSEGSQTAGQGAGQPGREPPQAQTTPVPARVSTPKFAPAPGSAGAAVVALRKAEPELDLGIPPQYSHDALADRFSKKYADTLSYVSTWGRWMKWDGARWAFDDTLETRDFARQIARAAANEAATNIELGRRAAAIATSLTSAGTIAAVETLAKADRRHAATSKQFDSDPWLLNTPGGVVNLQTGKMRPGKKSDYCSKITRVTPGGDCPTWLKFLDVATAGDDELVEFMRRMAGYCLTGITREHALFFVYGPGGNGKGTFLNTLDWIMADYAKTANMAMFVEQKFASHSTDVAGLMGARLVTAQETEEGKRWDEARLKTFTGGDPLTARFMRQDEFTFMPQFKLVFAGNHKPMLRSVDEAIRRRLFLIPFTVTVPARDKDPSLYLKLRDEAPGILKWCIEGCLDWQQNMLAPPARVLATTEEYFEAEDSIGTFFEETCDFNRNYSVTTAILYSRYVRWAESTGEYPLPKKRWLQQLAHRGMASVKKSGSMSIEGVRLKFDSHDDPRL